MVRLQWWGLYHDKPKIGTFMLRIKVPAGQIEPNHLRAVGEVSNLYGKGAGELPTASAVMSDIVDVARNIAGGTPRRLAMDFYDESRPLPTKSLDALATRYYLRFSVVDRPGVLAAIASVFGRQSISIASVVQREAVEGMSIPLIFLTHSSLEANLRAALAEIEVMDFVRAPTQVIRIED